MWDMQVTDNEDEDHGRLQVERSDQAADNRLRRETIT
jgi:hypothetical protein